MRVVKLHKHTKKKAHPYIYGFHNYRQFMIVAFADLDFTHFSLRTGVSSTGGRRVRRLTANVHTRHSCSCTTQRCKGFLSSGKNLDERKVSLNNFKYSP